MRQFEDVLWSDDSCCSVSPPRLHGVWYDFSQLQHPAVAHHPLPWERFSVRLLAAGCRGDARGPGDGGVDSVRPGAPAHRDLWHRGETGNRTPGPEEQKHPGDEGAALLHRGSRSVTSPVFYFHLSLIFKQIHLLSSASWQYIYIFCFKVYLQCHHWSAGNRHFTEITEGLDHKCSGVKCFTSKYIMVIKQICRQHLSLLSTVLMFEIVN